jgi:CRP/FNR family transcriptional regulator
MSRPERPAALTAIGETMVYQKGMIIVRPDTETACVFEIVSGLVKLYKLSDRNEQNIHIVFGPGDMFPLSWLVDKASYQTYVKSLNVVELLRYPKAEFIKLMHTDPEVLFFITTRLVSQMRLYIARVDNLQYKYASQRLAYRLIYLAHRFGIEADGEIALPVFSNRDIGSMTNLSREYVNRELSRFVRLGILRMIGKQVIIVDMAGLRNEVSNDEHALFIDDV